MRLLPLIIISLAIIGCDSDIVKQTQKLNNKNIENKTNITKEKIVKPQVKIVEKVVKKVSLEEKKMQNYQELETKKLDNKKSIKELEIQKEETLAKINAQKEQKIKELTENSKVSQKELEAKAKIREAEEKTKQINAQTQAKTKEKELDSKQQIAATKEHSSSLKVALYVIALIILMWIVFKYTDKSSKRRHEAKLKEQELQQQAFLEENRLKQENISKMLQIISDSKSDPQLKKDLTKLLTNTHGKK